MITHNAVIILCGLSCMVGFAVGYVIGYFVQKEGIREYYKQGYKQAEKDLLENKHEKSWRLDKKLWKDIKDIEEASYQYMYDASNDWAYDIPTWEDVQDAFKAGSEWKENLALTWRDMELIYNLSDEIPTMEHDVFFKEMLRRYKERKKELV